MIYFLKIEGLEQLQKALRLQKEYTKIRFGFFIEFPILSSNNQTRDSTFQLALKRLKGFPKIIQINMFYVDKKQVLQAIQDSIFIEADYILPTGHFSNDYYIQNLATIKIILKMLEADTQLLLPYSKLEHNDYSISKDISVDEWKSIFFDSTEDTKFIIPYIQSSKIKHTIQRWDSIKNLLSTHPDKQWIIYDFNRYWKQNIEFLKEGKIYGLISRNWVRRHLWYEQKIFPEFRQKLTDFF